MTKKELREMLAFWAGWADKMSVAGFIACFIYERYIAGFVVGVFFLALANILKYWSMK